MNTFLRSLLIWFILTPLGAWATHNRAGEITYKHMSGFTYLITVTTYTNELSVGADRCALDVSFGDGTWESVERTNNNPNTNCNNCNNCGETIGGNTKKNVYTTNHTFPSTGSYRISMEDPNRNEGVINIPNSIDVSFYLYAELNIFPDGVPNSSPILTTPPIDDACRNTTYEHNPGAVDYDITNNGLSDSLSYKLVACYGNNGDTIANFSYPDQWPAGPDNQISIDAVTGTLLWEKPQRSGEYNVAILIEEWRRIGNSVTKMGSVLRDLQITVDDCAFNNPPEIQPIADTCVTATEFINKTITAIDGDYLPPSFLEKQTVTLSATGDPLYVPGNKALFPTSSAQRTVTQSFTWSTQCGHIRNYPYFTVFRAKDDHPDIELTDYLDWQIQVLAPAPTNISASPIGEGINITWGYQQCANAAGYRIYRKSDSIGYIAPQCETGIPASTGYVLIGSTKGGSATSFFDNENGVGLVNAKLYCYMVFAYFDDGAESYPSVETCATLKKEVPIISRVSVNTTDLLTGSDSVKWAKPTELDTQRHPGPYQYKILRSANDGAYIEVGASNVNADLNLIDTVFVNTSLNTQEVQYSYRIMVYSNDTLIGPSRPASSPWLKAKPLDNRLELSLNINVPWTNSTMFVYRENAVGTYTYIDSSNSFIYTDSNLVNGREYCYYITTKGGYSDPALEFPLLNNSQRLCATPIDKQAPCAPQNLTVDSQCELFYNDLSWLNPNDICDTTDDVVSYNIYYSPFINDSLEIIQTVDGAENITYLFDNLESVAGCYAITAVDSFQNESQKSNTVCVDNCPYYELPNIFTPGVDGYNDTFMPFPNWRFVEKVDMNVYNRWGDEVYQTNDPALGWNGTSADDTNLPEGVYYYVCVVHEIKLEGIVQRILKGTVTLHREKSGEPQN